MKLKFSEHIFEKYINTKFHKNPSSGNQVVPCGRAEGRTDMRKLIVAFHNFVNEKPMWSLSVTVCFLKASHSIHTEFAAVAELAKGQLWKGMLT